MNFKFFAYGRLFFVTILLKIALPDHFLILVDKFQKCSPTASYFYFSAQNCTPGQFLWMNFKILPAACYFVTFLLNIALPGPGGRAGATCQDSTYSYILI